MSTSRTRKRPRSHRPEAVHKPRGAFHPRVQKVGPEHFGIVCVDCAKARSKWKLADFYGRILVPPTVVEHNRPAFDAAIAQLRQAIRDHDLKDVLVAIERTGRYHHAPRRAFAAAGFETRIVHPFATKTLRQPADPGNKTDDTDLDAIHRAAVNGFALVEHVLDESWSSFRLLVRHRRDLVQKAAALRTQIREHLDAALPGFAACFGDLWDSDCGWHLARHFATPADMVAAGLTGLRESLHAAHVRYQSPTLDTILAWAAQAAPLISAPPPTAAAPWPSTMTAHKKTAKSRPSSATSLPTCARPRMSCCSRFPASTSSAPPTLPPRRARWSTTPAHATSPAAPACDHPVTRAIK